VTDEADPVQRTSIRELVVLSDEKHGAGGFLEVRRIRLRNRRADGSLSPEYISDSIARERGQDAVVVVVYARTARGIEVLVREGLRPALVFGRDPARAPLPEEAPALLLTELVAGVIETSDHGEDGLRSRAAAEVLEEAGFVVAPSAIELLGPGMYASPGCLVEKNYFACVEVDPKAQRALAGDGSPMEEGARTRWLSLEEALAACASGTIVDQKTELGLRRVSDRLQVLR
jgi:ADP-ribose pyrophosphatase